MAILWYTHVLNTLQVKMIEYAGRTCEIDVRPVLGPIEYMKVMETWSGKPRHKVFVRNKIQKDRSLDGNVFEKIQYWYPEGELPNSCRLVRD